MQPLALPLIATLLIGTTEAPSPAPSEEQLSPADSAESTGPSSETPGHWDELSRDWAGPEGSSPASPLTFVYTGNARGMLRASRALQPSNPLACSLFTAVLGFSSSSVAAALCWATKPK